MTATDDARGDDVYQPDATTEVGDDAGLLDPEDTLLDRAAGPYEEGWSPPERPLAVEHQGTTAAEQNEGESLDQRLAEEVPDPTLAVPAQTPTDGTDETADTSEEPRDEEVGAARAGRLRPRATGPSTFATDVGVDGGAASAEEAAVHIVPDEEP
ncbi:DUF5709 domain-containing protein [Kitasatospora sp. NPDC086009]|uniref:DUF5709 domain-containing protein n=1 Tax=unclassified Kitasatospora TaxID=2633591 RepID=UPI0033DD4877